MAEYKAQKDNYKISPRDAEDILEPVQKSLRDYGVELGNDSVFEISRFQRLNIFIFLIKPRSGLTYYTIFYNINICIHLTICFH